MREYLLSPHEHRYVKDHEIQLRLAEDQLVIVRQIVDVFKPVFNQFFGNLPFVDALVSPQELQELDVGVQKARHALASVHPAPAFLAGCVEPTPNGGIVIGQESVCSAVHSNRLLADVVVPIERFDGHFVVDPNTVATLQRSFQTGTG